MTRWSGREDFPNRSTSSEERPEHHHYFYTLEQWFNNFIISTDLIRTGSAVRPHNTLHRRKSGTV
jgi:hypothetical protein